MQGAKGRQLQWRRSLERPPWEPPRQVRAARARAKQTAGPPPVGELRWTRVPLVPKARWQPTQRSRQGSTQPGA